MGPLISGSKGMARPKFVTHLFPVCHEIVASRMFTVLVHTDTVINIARLQYHELVGSRHIPSKLSITRCIFKPPISAPGLSQSVS